MRKLPWRTKNMVRILSMSFPCSTKQKPGPVVRVSPNELSFATAESWKDIYSIPTGGQKPFVKSDFYSMFGAGFKSRCIGSERDPKKHRRIRGLLNSCFSYRTLLEQEDILHPLMDEFVGKFEPQNNEEEKIVDMTAWYGMLGFDLMGEMSFGESFHAIQSGKRRNILLSLDLTRQVNRISGQGLSLIIWPL
jgi:hypothetical protein